METSSVAKGHAGPGLIIFDNLLSALLHHMQCFSHEMSREELQNGSLVLRLKKDCTFVVLLPQWSPCPRSRYVSLFWFTVYHNYLGHFLDTGWLLIAFCLCCCCFVFKKAERRKRKGREDEMLDFTLISPFITWRFFVFLTWKTLCIRTFVEQCRF